MGVPQLRRHTIGPPVHLPKFFADDLFGVGVRAKDYALRKLRSEITTPQYIMDTNPDFNSFFTPILTGRFHKDFRLRIHVEHSGWLTLGARALLELKTAMCTAVSCLKGKNMKVHITHQQFQVPAWNSDALLQKPNVDLLVALYDVISKMNT